MQQLNVFSDDADQIVTFPLPDGSGDSVVLEFIYRPGIQRWTMNLTHPVLTLANYNLVQSPNILRPWKNLISFGMAILSTTGLDPMNPTDLEDGTITINMLDASEVQLVETQIMAPTPLVNP